MESMESMAGEGPISASTMLYSCLTNQTTATRRKQTRAALRCMWQGKKQLCMVSGEETQATKREKDNCTLLLRQQSRPAAFLAIVQTASPFPLHKTLPRIDCHPR